MSMVNMAVEDSKFRSSYLLVLLQSQVSSVGSSAAGMLTSSSVRPFHLPFESLGVQSDWSMRLTDGIRLQTPSGAFERKLFTIMCQSVEGERQFIQ
ncbi:hypothetical protein CEXT_575271 [Caerostris extrusa]|uniref:Uncharacterized protein n=1 Tax=Caerostris extrusa TaxID=172846 RepID=A0AAV4Q097_CAEEX|nr:hypothetical protein CEXT_575271 [Caerostris extrusa]